MNGTALGAGCPSPGFITLNKQVRWKKGWRARPWVMTFLSLVILFLPLVSTTWPASERSSVPMERLFLGKGTTVWQSPAGAANMVQLSLVAGDQSVSKQKLGWITSIIQNDAWPVIQSVFSGESLSNLTIVFFSTEPGYESAVRKQFSGNAKDIASRTGGFTVGTTVYIPIYKYTSKGPLANTIAHELTHVFLNVSGISRVLPEWMNEGFAWTVGLQAQSKVDKSSASELLALLSTELDSARRSGPLAPLTTRTTVGLQKNFEYNLEFEDYLAVKSLEQMHGTSSMTQFLHEAAKEGLDQGFQSTFGLSIGSYENAFYKDLSLR